MNMQLNVKAKTIDVYYYEGKFMKSKHLNTEKISDEDVGVISSYGLIDFQLIRNTFSKYEVNLADEVKEVTAKLKNARKKPTPQGKLDLNE